MGPTTCPGCGAPRKGRRCRVCGYEPFGGTVSAVPKVPSRQKTAGSTNAPRKHHPLLRFFVILALINALMPALRNWGLKLEAAEEINRSAAREPVVPATDIFTLYLGENIHIFTTKYDAEHFADSLTLYVQNDTGKDLEIRSTQFLINGIPQEDRELYCRAGADAIGKTWLYLDKALLKQQGISRVRSLSLLLEVRDSGGSRLFATELITLGDDPAA